MPKMQQDALEQGMRFQVRPTGLDSNSRPDPSCFFCAVEQFIDFAMSCCLVWKLNLVLQMGSEVVLNDDFESRFYMYNNVDKIFTSDSKKGIWRFLSWSSG